MDKNEVYESLQRIVGVATAIADKIANSDTLTIAEYLALADALDGMKIELNKLELFNTVYRE